MGDKTAPKVYRAGISHGKTNDLGSGNISGLSPGWESTSRLLYFRSRMNVPFWLNDESLNQAFLAQSKQAGLLALEGHRMVGGMRASIYNAMPIEGIKALVDFMHKFEKEHN